MSVLPFTPTYLANPEVVNKTTGERTPLTGWMFVTRDTAEKLADLLNATAVEYGGGTVGYWTHPEQWHIDYGDGTLHNAGAVIRQIERYPGEYAREMIENGRAVPDFLSAYAPEGELHQLYEAGVVQGTTSYQAFKQLTSEEQTALIRTAEWQRQQPTYESGAADVSVPTQTSTPSVTDNAPGPQTNTTVPNVTDASLPPAGTLAAIKAAGIAAHGTNTLNADQWAYFFHQQIPVTLPAPEEYGFSDEDRFARVTFETWISKLAAAHPDIVSGIPTGGLTPNGGSVIVDGAIPLNGSNVLLIVGLAIGAYLLLK